MEIVLSLKSLAVALLSFLGHCKMKKLWAHFDDPQYDDSLDVH